MRCPEFANIDELLDQLQARWLFAIDMGSPDARGVYATLFRIAFVPTVEGMQFLLAVPERTSIAPPAFFPPGDRSELKKHVGMLIEKFENRCTASSCETSNPAGSGLPAPTHHLYPIASEERRHSAR